MDPRTNHDRQTDPHASEVLDRLLLDLDACESFDEALTRLLRVVGDLFALLGVSSDQHGALRPELRRAAETIADSIGEKLGRIRAAEACRTSGETNFEPRPGPELLFVRHSPLLAYIKEVGPEGSVVLEASESFRDLVGTAELRGKTNEDLFPPDFAAKMTADDRTAVEQNLVLRLEEEFEGRSYTTIKFPLQLGQRRLLAGFTIDVTESKRLERELRSRESHLRAIIENQPGLVWLKDSGGRFLSVNQAFASSAGQRSPDDVVGLNDFDVWPEDLARRYREDDAAVMAAGKARIVEEPIAGPGGARWFETFKAPLFDESHAVVGTTGYARDITERRRAAEERERLIERLNQAQKLEALGVLSGGIAHDFNNLLSGIFGCIDLARCVESAPEREQYLAQALSSMERARALTHQLLTFAKGGVPVKTVQPLGPLVKSTVKFALSGSPVRCHYDIAPDLWAAEFDQHQIAQAIENIVINAVQAMPGGGDLEVTARNQHLEQIGHATLPPGAYVTIAIQDHGVGMSADQMRRIFDPFYTTKPKGQGLGLATSFSIVTRHGGSIDVESTPGAGSVFRITLPAAPHYEPTAQAATDECHRGSGTLLVMDDDEVVRETTAAMLEQLGYDTILVREGREALAALQAQRAAGNELAAMMLDLTIQGGMGGKEAIQEIRRLDPRIPVFVCSGYADDPVMAEPLKYGFTASLSKPFRLADLCGVLEQYPPARGK